MPPGGGQAYMLFLNGRLRTVLMRIASVIADGKRGTALILDSGTGPAMPGAAIEEWGAQVAAILRTHGPPQPHRLRGRAARTLQPRGDRHESRGIPEPKACEAAVQAATMCGVARNSLQMMRLRTSAHRRLQSVADSSIVVARRVAVRRGSRARTGCGRGHA
jgi:hypothetical protein